MIARIALFFGLMSVQALHPLQAQIDMSAAPSGKELMKTFLGKDIEVTNINYYGAPDAIGLFKNANNLMDIKAGMYLGTGHYSGPLGPNNRGNSTTLQKQRGIMLAKDPDLASISSGTCFDISILEFSFIPSCETISFNYVFASEEYMEYVNQRFNDAFGFFISGPGISGTKNIALLPDGQSSISINNVNLLKNSEYYVDYSRPNRNAPEYQNSLQFDGYTKKLTAKAGVIPGQQYTIKIAIADVNDGTYDSGVFLEANSFGCYSSPAMEASKPVRKDSVVATYNINIEFGFNSYVIPEKFYPELDRICKQLQKNANYHVEINGHTDDVGSAEYNLVLSEKRAQSVARYLEQKGIATNRIQAKGLGNTRPLNRNKTEKEKALNRRVEFIIKL